MKSKVGRAVASILAIVTILVWGFSPAASASDVEFKKALSADAAVEINAGHIHYLGEYVISNGWP